MNWKRVLNPRITTPRMAFILVAAHAILHAILSGRDVLSVVFSPGGNAPGWMWVTVVFFAAIRMLVFTWVPAVFTWHAVRWVAATRGEARGPADTTTRPPP